MAAAMYTNQDTTIMPAPLAGQNWPVEPITSRTALKGFVPEPNGKLAELRSQIFGEDESNPVSKQGGPMPSLNFLLNEIVEGVCVAHGQSIVHRL